MKHKMYALSLLLTIFLGSILWIVGNLMGLPEESILYTVVTVQIGIGFFLAVPLTIVHLLRLKS
jgi:hypothetical protein